MPLRLTLNAANCFLWFLVVGGVTIDVYTDAQPSGGADAPATGTKLVTFYNANGFNAGGTPKPINGTITLTGLPLLSSSAIATGTAGWARMTGTYGAVDMSCALSGANVAVLSRLDVVKGIKSTLTGLTFALPLE